MFCTVTVLPREKRGLFLRRRCLVENVQTAVKGGAPFRRLTVTPGRKGVDWPLVEQAAGRSGRFTLAPDGVEWPPSCRLRRFEPEVLPLKIMLNTAAKALKDGHEQGRTLLICDEAAVLSPFLDQVVLCASTIRVQTERPELYYEAAARVMERFGAAVAVSPMGSAAGEVDAAVAGEPGMPGARGQVAAHRPPATRGLPRRTARKRRPKGPGARRAERLQNSPPDDLAEGPSTLARMAQGEGRDDRIRRRARHDQVPCRDEAPAGPRRRDARGPRMRQVRQGQGRALKIVFQSGTAQTNSRW